MNNGGERERRFLSFSFLNIEELTTVSSEDPVGRLHVYKHDPFDCDVPINPTVRDWYVGAVS